MGSRMTRQRLNIGRMYVGLAGPGSAHSWSVFIS